ncbi:MAG: undecaprenyl/decaprenyl-phosphate alpha-N-acetylglucosaminyl 1-phosphate transferase [Clostridia bacterium]|nr:undecaprenyl/decaprenyl-phosphate alpha-N-acetylglucosaminyl 1-phosphate transferase [Clostridia bacterium]
MALSLPFLFLLSCLLATFFTPLSMALAVKVRAIDLPDGRRKLHASPTPRLGGVAVFLAVATVALFLLPSSPLKSAWLTGGALLCALGVSDDVFALSPRLKLFAMSAILLLPVCFGLAPKGLALGPLFFSLPPFFGGLLAFFWTLTLVNAFNLMDGLDGLASVQGMIASLFLALSGASAAALLCGALTGFLPYNRSGISLWRHHGRLPTRSFLGDTGALFVGYTLSLLSLDRAELFSLFFPLLFLLPLYEVTSSVCRRLRKGKSPFSADCDHLHHRLRREGYSAASAVLLLSLYTLLFGALFFFAETVAPLL